MLSDNSLKNKKHKILLGLFLSGFFSHFESGFNFRHFKDDGALDGSIAYKQKTILLKACNFTKSNTPQWVFSRFLNCTNGTKSSHTQIFCTKVFVFLQSSAGIYFSWVAFNVRNFLIISSFSTVLQRRIGYCFDVLSESAHVKMIFIRTYDS